ncbi:MAG: ribonuclease H-like domain-containing protein, partial [Treponema sp.]|nr:ribonuclease H-like domain-containing protein [Treponema sp.]
MANLKKKKKRVHDQRKSERPKNDSSSSSVSVLIEQGWENCGFKVLKRDISFEAPFKLNTNLPRALEVVVPDLSGRNLPQPEDFLFFDLETTGLSGGAGTVAVLAAFGKPLPKDKLIVTQYLLLDYPGEDDFLENVLNEFKKPQSVIVTYNGKCFDSQILKTRCLMNGIKPPEYHHADLLHPARRLWKNIIHDCSQASIETRILGLDRSDDIPGALAPEIWFEFLKTGRTERL